LINNLSFVSEVTMSGVSCVGVIATTRNAIQDYYPLLILGSLLNHFPTSIKFSMSAHIT
jgi:hypothetical protein